MRKLPDWACANGVLAHVPDDKKQTCEFTVELKLAGEAIDSRNKAASEAIRFFFVAKFFFVAEFFVVTKFFFVTGTIVPVPIPCAGLPLEAGLFCAAWFARRCRRGVRCRCRMGFGIVRNYWWRGQNAFSGKYIGELLDSWANGQVRTRGQVLLRGFLLAHFFVTPREFRLKCFYFC